MRGRKEKKKENLEPRRGDVKTEPRIDTCENSNRKQPAQKSEYQGLCLPFSPVTVLFSLFIKSNGLSSCYVFSLFSNNEWRLIANQDDVFLCSLLFHLAKLLRGSDWNLRRSAILVNPLKLRWYKCLCSAVIVPMSAENCGVTNIYLTIVLLQ